MVRIRYFRERKVILFYFIEDVFNIGEFKYVRNNDNKCLFSIDGIGGEKFVKCEYC